MKQLQKDGQPFLGEPNLDAGKVLALIEQGIWTEKDLANVGLTVVDVPDPDPEPDPEPQDEGPSLEDRVQALEDVLTEKGILTESETAEKRASVKDDGTRP